MRSRTFLCSLFLLACFAAGPLLAQEVVLSTPLHYRGYAPGQPLWSVQGSGDRTANITEFRDPTTGAPVTWMDFGGRLNTVRAIISAQWLNNIRFADQFPGADVGAKINAAVAASGGIPVKIIASPGIISTSPNLPMGFSLSFLPGTYTLSTTWYLRHRGVSVDFGGARISFSGDAALPAIVIGKSLSSTVNTNGTAVARTAGDFFTEYDPGDQIAINGAMYNIASITDASNLILTATAGVQAGVASAGYLNPERAFGSYNSPVRLHNLTLVYTGAGTTAVDGVRLDFVTGTELSHLSLMIFPATGAALHLRGALSSRISDLNIYSSGRSLILDRLVAGGVDTGSNRNAFYGGSFINNGVAGNESMIIDHASTHNLFSSLNFEGNYGRYTIYIQGISNSNIFRDCVWESNGDGNAASWDVSVTGGAVGTIFDGDYFTSAVVNYPAGGISMGAASYTVIQNTRFVGVQTTSYNYNGTTGKVSNVERVGAYANPAVSVEFPNGDYTTRDLIARRINTTGGTALTAGDFALVTTGGWGDTPNASISGAGIAGAFGTDQANFWIVSAGTANFGANPTVTLTFKDLTWTTDPICTASRRDATAPTTGFPTVVTTATTMVLTFQGLPAAGTYGFNVVCMGR